MKIFALGSTRRFGEQIAAHLNRKLDALEERDFDDGEHKIRPMISVRDEDVYVVHSLYTDESESVNDKLCKLLFLISTLKDAGAARVTAVVPYLCYARKDRRTKARDPVTIRYVATLFEAARADRIVTLDVHNVQAFENAFRIPVVHLEAQKLFVPHLRKIPGMTDIVVMSPDIGGFNRALSFRERLSRGLSKEIGFAFVEKLRSKGVVSSETVAGDVKGKTVVIIDDLINGGITLSRAAVACRFMEAKEVYAVVTHAVFTAKANIAFKERNLKKVIITNTVTLDILEKEIHEFKIDVLDATPLFAEVIERLSSGGSITSLMEIE